MYQFDLVAWLDGETKSSPGVILAMLRYLPEGCPFTAKMSALAELERRKREEAGEPDPEPETEYSEENELIKLTHEYLTYGTTNRLISVLINRTSQGIEAQFSPKHRPNWPAIGPASWVPKTKTNDTPVSEETSGTQDSLLVRAFARMGGYQSG